MDRNLKAFIRESKFKIAISTILGFALFALPLSCYFVNHPLHYAWVPTDLVLSALLFRFALLKASETENGIIDRKNDPYFELDYYDRLILSIIKLLYDNGIYIFSDDKYSPKNEICREFEAKTGFTIIEAKDKYIRVKIAHFTASIGRDIRFAPILLYAKDTLLLSDEITSGHILHDYVYDIFYRYRNKELFNLTNILVDVSKEHAFNDYQLHEMDRLVSADEIEESLLVNVGA